MGDDATSMKPASAEQVLFAEALQCATPEARAAYHYCARGTDTALGGRVEAEGAARLQPPKIVRIRETLRTARLASLGGIGASHMHETSSSH